jgi:ATP-dependent 26S proteasome regulatory subunit
MLMLELFHYELLHQIKDRQTKRISANKHDATIDKFELTQQDFLGVTVYELESCKSWKTLESMIGLTKVKLSIRNLTEMLKTDIVLELDNRIMQEVALNRLFLGNPGTGKTTVAKLYADILLHLGLLSKGEAHSYTASQFVGTVLGESAKITRDILTKAEGCVCIIDEAYSLHAGKGVGGSYSGGDAYKTDVIDAIVEQV